TIDPDSTPVMLADHRIVLTTASGSLVIVDALTGQLQWTGAANGTLGTVGELTIGDTPVLASYTDDEALLWPLDDPDTPSAQTLTVEVGPAEALITSAPAPLWILEPQTVTYLAGNALALVDVPVPAISAGTHHGAVVAVDAGSWVSITADNAAKRHSLEGAPTDAEPLQGRVLGPEHLAVLWGTQNAATLTLHELPEGALIGQLDELDGPDQNDADEPRMSPDGTTWVWHNVFISPSADTPLTALNLTLPSAEDDPQQPLEVSSVSDAALWGHLESSPARYDITTREATFYDEGVTIPLGESRDASLVYIVASRLEETSLYALPATPPAPSDGGDS
ncbi:MAG: hypothetical protein L0G46_06285, partial [Kocuria sp.]|nr:hypothetical protein [Kocuria sp.]